MVSLWMIVCTAQTEGSVFKSSAHRENAGYACDIPSTGLGTEMRIIGACWPVAFFWQDPISRKYCVCVCVYREGEGERESAHKLAVGLA